MEKEGLQAYIIIRKSSSKEMVSNFKEYSFLEKKVPVLIEYPLTILIGNEEFFLPTLRRLASDKKIKLEATSQRKEKLFYRKIGRSISSRIFFELLAVGCLFMYSCGFRPSSQKEIPVPLSNITECGPNDFLFINSDTLIPENEMNINFILQKSRKIGQNIIDDNFSRGQCFSPYEVRSAMYDHIAQLISKYKIGVNQNSVSNIVLKVEKNLQDLVQCNKPFLMGGGSGSGSGSGLSSSQPAQSQGMQSLTAQLNHRLQHHGIPVSKAHGLYPSAHARNLLFTYSPHHYRFHNDDLRSFSLFQKNDPVPRSAFLGRRVPSTIRLVTPEVYNHHPNISYRDLLTTDGIYVGQTFCLNGSIPFYVGKSGGEAISAGVRSRWINEAYRIMSGRCENPLVMQVRDLFETQGILARKAANFNLTSFFNDVPAVPQILAEEKRTLKEVLKSGKVKDQPLTSYFNRNDSRRFTEKLEAKGFNPANYQAERPIYFSLNNKPTDFPPGMWPLTFQQVHEIVTAPPGTITQEYVNNLYRENYQRQQHTTFQDYLRSKNMTFQQYIQSKANYYRNN